MPINAGDLDRRVDLVSIAETRVKGVVTAKTETTYAAGVYASVQPISGREFFASQQVNSQVTWRVTIRYRTDVAAQHRVVYGTRTFEIVFVQPDEGRKESLTLMCREMNG